MARASLHERLAELKQRLLAISLSASAGWALAAALGALLAFMWIDLAIDLSPMPRLICLGLAAALGIVIAWRLAVDAAKQCAQGAVARRLDRAANARGQILSGVELLPQSALPSRGQTLTSAMAQLAVDRASFLAAAVYAPAAAPVTALYRAAVGLGAIALVATVIAISAPRLAATQWSRFFDPYGDHPPYSAIDFSVKPGDTKVLYGSSLDIRASAAGQAVEDAEVVLQPLNSSTPETLPMFPEGGGKWRATVANITEPARYFIRSRGARSHKFDIEVITVPKLQDVRFRIAPPAYTRRAPLEGPLPASGIAALPGTVVTVWAKSNRPLSGGKLLVDSAQATGSATQPTIAARYELTSISAGANEVTGSFVVQQAGKLALKVADTAGQESTDSFTASITLLRDERPFVRILQPQSQSFATPDTMLDVQLMAEDDYGVSRLQLFRSLNDSRATPMEVAVSSPQEPRVPASVPMPLGSYGLAPGDQIKLFARVEDNDPAGAKGSESPIVNLHIISKEQMQQMMLAREELETLASKYEQASRRMEAASNQIDKLLKELEKANPNSELSQKLRQQLQDAAEQFAADAQEIARIAGEDLPFDLDKALKKQLEQAKEAMEQAAESARSLSARPGASVSDARKELEEAQKKLGQRRDQFKQEASDPLEHLSKIFPLIEAQSRFIDLYQRQRDLAQRMDAFSAHDAEDDPRVKARMRDLENEQRQIRQDLRQLLDDIENRAAELPADPRLDDLRKTAREFADAVRKSNAADEMAAAESGLAEFAGARAHVAAQAAADTLARFIGQCNGMGEQAGDCLKFQPKLASNLGNTVQELLEAEGLGTKAGMGSGMGGYSARRNSLRNVGLYGQIPRASRASGQQGGHAQSGISASGAGQSADPNDPSNAGAGSRLRASGQSDAPVPAQYKRRVGEYFQRVADELDQGQGR